MMRSSNPVLGEKTFRDLAPAGVDSMSVQGTVNKTLFLLLGVLVAASWTWSMYFDFEDQALVFPWMIGGAIGSWYWAPKKNKRHARQDSAEHFSRLGALLFTAMAWIFIPAYCFAIP